MKTFSYTVTTLKVIKESDIYTNGFTIPAGYELTGEFRIPVIGESFLHSEGGGKVVQATTKYSDDSARLIVRKPRVLVVTFRSTSETRQPKSGEGYFEGSRFCVANFDHTGIPSQVFTKTEHFE